MEAWLMNDTEALSIIAKGVTYDIRQRYVPQRVRFKRG